MGVCMCAHAQVACKSAWDAAMCRAHFEGKCPSVVACMPCCCMKVPLLLRACPTVPPLQTFDSKVICTRRASCSSMQKWVWRWLWRLGDPKPGPRGTCVEQGIRLTRLKHAQGWPGMGRTDGHGMTSDGCSRHGVTKLCSRHGVTKLCSRHGVTKLCSRHGVTNDAAGMV